MDTEGPCDDPGNDELLKNWGTVDNAMDKIFDSNFRSLYKDSLGNDFKVGWFFLTWTGFKTNPRGRDFGYHKIRDHYHERWGKLMNNYGDEECWHYHHPPRSGIGNEWSAEWESSEEYKYIISRQILERGWFPTCFRAGGTIMGPELSQWIDEWFPFDYSNRAPLKFNLMDWSDGLADWQTYRPDPTQFKRKGTGKRYMARCMDLKTGLYTTGEQDIAQAFKEASLRGSSILSVFDHDYRDIKDRIIIFLENIVSVAKSYPDINWEYSTPSKAIINSLNIEKKKIFQKTTVKQSKIIIETSSDIYQEFPWAAVKYNNGIVDQVENRITRLSDKTWEFDISNIQNLKTVGIAVSNSSGESDVALMNY